MIETIKAIAADMRNEAGLPSISIAHTALQNLVDSWAARLESITALSNQGEGVSDYCRIAGCVHKAHGCPTWPDDANPFAGAEADRRDAVPFGWQAIIVNHKWMDLMESMDRADRKGYMPDSISDDWESFDWKDYPIAATQEQT